MEQKNLEALGFAPESFDRLDPFSLLVKDFLENLMLEERTLFIENGNDSSNGFRYRKFFSNDGQRMSLAVPRVRKEKFVPHVLRHLNTNRSDLEILCFLLYGEGSSIEETRELFTKLYKPCYTPAEVDKLFTRIRALSRSWRKREIANQYDQIIIDPCHIFRVECGRARTISFAVVSANIPGEKTGEVLGIYRDLAKDRTAWGELFSDLKKRGLERVERVAADVDMQIEDAISKAFPEAEISLFVSD